MPSKTLVAFRVKNKGGPSGGKELSHLVPEFNLSEFMKAPNAGEFVRKAYDAEVKKLIREISESKNGTASADLESYESVIARATSYTKEEVSGWIASRDWSQAKDVANMEKLLPQLQKQLPILATRSNPFDQETSAKLAHKVIAAVADDPDPIAEFLFTALTTQRSNPNLLEL